MNARKVGQGCLGAFVGYGCLIAGLFVGDLLVRGRSDASSADQDEAPVSRSVRLARFTADLAAGTRLSPAHTEPYEVEGKDAPAFALAADRVPALDGAVLSRARRKGETLCRTDLERLDLYHLDRVPLVAAGDPAGGLDLPSSPLPPEAERPALAARVARMAKAVGLEAAPYDLLSLGATLNALLSRLAEAGHELAGFPAGACRERAGRMRAAWVHTRERISRQAALSRACGSVEDALWAESMLLRMEADAAFGTGGPSTRAAADVARVAEELLGMKSTAPVNRPRDTIPPATSDRTVEVVILEDDVAVGECLRLGRLKKLEVDAAPVSEDAVLANQLQELLGRFAREEIRSGTIFHWKQVGGKAGR